MFKCKYCDFSDWNMDNDIEEELWGHIQKCHPTVFEDVQDWETATMLGEIGRAHV